MDIKLVSTLAAYAALIYAAPLADAIAVSSVDQVPDVESRGQQIADEKWAIGLVVYYDADDKIIGSASAIGFGSSTGALNTDRWATAGHVVASILSNPNVARVEIRLGKASFADPDAVVTVFHEVLHPEYAPGVLPRFYGHFKKAR